jgi:hypothetical protein
MSFGMSPPLLRTIAPVSAAAPLHFNNLTEVFRYIVQARGLGKTDDEALVRALAAGSTVQQVRDSSGNSLTVIKANLVADGTSRLASAEGNFPNYVLRESAEGISLLGTMFGESYSTNLADGHLQFTLRLRMAAGHVRQMRFQVRGEALVNLTPLKLQGAPYIADV